MNNPFILKYRKGNKTRYPQVHLFLTGLYYVLPTQTADKNKSLNEAIDRAIEKLEELRPKQKICPICRMSESQHDTPMMGHPDQKIGCRGYYIRTNPDR